MKLLLCAACIFGLSIGFVFPAKAQLNLKKIDSLKEVLPASNGTDRFDVLYGLAYEYSNEIESESLKYASQAYDFALVLGDTSRIIKGGRIKATQLRRTEDIDGAIHLAEIILPIAKQRKNWPEVKILLTSLAMSHNLKAEYDKSLMYNFESLAILETEGDKKWISITLNNISIDYYKLYDPTKAIEFGLKSLELKNRNNDRYDLDRLLINIGLYYSAAGDHSKSLKFIREGLIECGGKCSDQILIEGEIALGAALMETKEYSESLMHLKKSYEISKRSNNYRFQSENLNNMAEVYMATKNYKEAMRLLKLSEEIAHQRKYRLLSLQVYKYFAKLYNQTGDFKNASLYQTKYIDLNDSIYGGAVNKNVAQAMTDFEERTNKKIIAEKNQILLLQERLLEKQKLQTYLVASIAVLLLILTILVYKNYREKLLINLKLDQKVKERTEELREVNSNLTKAYELRESVINKTRQDVQTVISSLQGLCRVAQLDTLDEKAKAYVQRFEDSATRLASLFSKVED